MTNLPRIKLKSEEPAYRQVEQVLRASIVSGELPCGSRLPTVQELAARYATSVFTIQTALDALAKDGLIERARRRGTFVTSRSAKLRQVGIYLGTDFVQGRAMGFYQELNRQLTEELERRGIGYHLWVDGRSKDRRGEPLRDLAEAVSKNQIQALMVGVTSIPELVWLRRLGIPLSLFSSGPFPDRVGIDEDRTMSLVMQEFKRLGCRTIGSILPFSATMHGPLETDAPPSIKAWFRRFAASMAEAGLKTRDAWMRVPSEFMDSSVEHEGYGYRQFQALWKQAKHPDGLLVWPDTVVRGCITAILEAGISIPGELKLVMHRNAGVPILCPFPVSWIEIDVVRIAAALIRQVERQLAGEPVDAILVPPSLA